ncbi:MAG: pyridoxal phosphate-dependent aminotransferase [Actinomycetota bacterium]
MTVADTTTTAPPLRFSRRVDEIPPALSVWVNQLVYDLRRLGRDVTTLSLGEAFFEIPRFSFEALDFERGYHYSDSQGLPELRDRIAEYYRDHYGAAVDGASEVLVSAGSKPIIAMCMQALLDPGDEVVIHEPAWLSYQEQARLCGASVRFVRHDVPLASFGEHLGPRTRLVILNNPNNPAGWVYGADELVGLATTCRRNGAFLMVDEAYSDFVLDGSFRALPSLVPDLDGVIAVNSLSKNMGMSGWRIGYAIAQPALIDRLLKLNQHLITCAPTVLQQYLVRYFDEILAHTLPQVRAVVEKRERVGALLDRRGIDRLPGGATFYYFLDVGDFDGDTMDLVLALLLEHDVALVPGGAYGASTADHVRLSIGTETEERIDAALGALQHVLRTGVDRDRISTEMGRLGLRRWEGTAR